MGQNYIGYAGFHQEHRRCSIIVVGEYPIRSYPRRGYINTKIIQKGVQISWQLPIENGSVVPWNY